MIMNILEKFRHTYDSYFFNRKVQKTIGEDFFFIQIGACDGKEFDPIYRLVQEHNLAGVLVEPHSLPIRKAPGELRRTGQSYF
jgi:hypothetical protein